MIEASTGKFLVDLVDRFSKQELFVGLWVLIIVLLVWAILSHRNYLDRRNFKPEQKPPKPDSNRLTK